MKKTYSTIMMLAMMVAALSFTACSSDADDNNDGTYGDDEYIEITINGETHMESETATYYVFFPELVKDGKEFFLYGIMSDHISISEYDGAQFSVIAGHTSKDRSSVYPKSTGTYDIITYDYFTDRTEIPENVGMVITGGNMTRRTVTSGSLKITKVAKVNNPTIKLFYGREGYATEGTFSFTLTGFGNETEISGKFRLIF